MQKRGKSLAVLMAGLCMGAAVARADQWGIQLAGLRFQHLSNAGFKHPNPGTDFNQAYVQYDF
jgi:hypothetical protein